MISARIAQQIGALSLVIHGVLLICLFMNFSRDGINPSLFGIAVGFIPLYIGSGVMRGSKTQTKAGIGWMVLFLGLCLVAIYVSIFGPFYYKGGGHTSADLHPLAASISVAWAVATIVLLRISQRHQIDPLK